MPSLRTSNKSQSSDNIPTYDFVVCHEDHVNIHSTTLLKNKSPWIYCCCHLAYFNCLIMTINWGVVFVVQYWVYNDLTSYEKYEIYWYKDFLYYVIIITFSIFFLVCHFFNVNNTNNRIANVIVCMTINLIINGIIVYYLLKHRDWSSTYNPFYFACDFFVCGPVGTFTVFVEYFHFVIPAILPLLTALVLWSIQHCTTINILQKKRRVKKLTGELIGNEEQTVTINGTNNINGISTSINNVNVGVDYSVSGTFIDYDHDDQFMKNDEKYTITTIEFNHKTLPKNGLMKLIAGYWFIWMIYCGIFYFLNFPNDKVVLKHWEIYYYIGTITNSFFKWVCKKIARRIDVQRIKLLRNRNNFQNNNKSVGQSTDVIDDHDNCNSMIFSYEWIAELQYSAVYWFWFRWIMIVHFRALSTFEIVSTMGIHLGSESFQTAFKLTPFYYKHHNDIAIWLKNQCTHWVDDDNYNVYDDNCIKRFLFWLNLQLFDDSNELEWIIRNTIDIGIRFKVSLMSGIYFVLLIFIGGKQYAMIEFEYSELTGLLYSVIVIVFDLTAYIAAYLIHSMLYNDIKWNMIVHYQICWKQHKKMWIITWLSSFLLVFALF